MPTPSLRNTVDRIAVEIFRNHNHSAARQLADLIGKANALRGVPLLFVASHRICRLSTWTAPDGSVRLALVQVGIHELLGIHAQAVASPTRQGRPCCRWPTSLNKVLPAFLAGVLPRLHVAGVPWSPLAERGALGNRGGGWTLFADRVVFLRPTTAPALAPLPAPPGTLYDAQRLFVGATGGWTHERWRRRTYPNDGFRGGPTTPRTAENKRQVALDDANHRAATQAAIEVFANDLGMAYPPRSGASIATLRRKPAAVRHWPNHRLHELPGLSRYATLDHSFSFRPGGGGPVALTAALPYGPHDLGPNDLIDACASIGLEVRAFQWTWWHPFTIGLMYWSASNIELTKKIEAMPGYVSPMRDAGR